MPRILPTLSPRALWQQRDDRRPLWWADMARWCIPLVGASILGSYLVWEPIARIGALLLVWIVICAALGIDPRRDDRDTPAPIRPRSPRGGHGRRAPRTPQRRPAARGPRTPARRASRRRAQRRTPVACATPVPTPARATSHD